MVTESDDLNDLAYFAWVVEAGGFSPAGREHGIAKSRLSRRIKALEERLGVRLLQRSTRRFSVTSIGQTFYQHCKAVLLEAEAAHEAVSLRQGEPCGVVRLSCPLALLHYSIGDLLNRFMAGHPRVTLELAADNRRVDVVGEGIDVALRVRFPPLDDSELVMRRLGESAQCLVATPALLEQFGRPAAPAALSQLPSLATVSRASQHQWTLEDADGQRETVRHVPRLVTDDMRQLRQAALAGLGVVQLPRMAIRDALAERTLEQVLPDWRSESGIVHAVFASRRGMLPAVRQLVDFLAEGYQASAPG